MNLPIAISWGPGEIILVLAVMLLLFGSSKLPKLARGLGQSVTEFRKGLRGEGDDKKKLEGGGGNDGDDGKDKDTASSSEKSDTPGNDAKPSE